MNIRSFLDKVEGVVLKGLDEGQEVVEETVDNVKERWAEFQEDMKSVPSFFYIVYCFFYNFLSFI